MDWRPALVCPVCRGALSFGDEVTCTSCGRTYAIAHGVPLLLPDTGAPGVLRPSTQTLPSLPPLLRRAAGRVRPYVVPEMTHKSRRAKRLIPAFASSVTGRIVNVGSGSKRYGAHVLNLDLAPTEGVDVVGVAEHLPLGDGAFDGAILQAVLEHVEDADATLAELRRVLCPGGQIFVEIPFMQGYHGGPSDYLRFTELGLQRALEQHGFEVTATGVAVGPGSGAAWVLAEYLALLLSIGSRSYRASRLLTRWLTWPLKWTDVWLDRHPMGFVVASGVWAQGRRTP